jgi:hypothetical protein
MQPVDLSLQCQTNKARKMNTQTNAIAALLLKYAKSDLRIAKKNGCVAICGTQQGNVEIEFFPADKTFQASNFNNTNIKLTGIVSEKEMLAFVAGIYVVETA